MSPSRRRNSPFLTFFGMNSALINSNCSSASRKPLRWKNECNFSNIGTTSTEKTDQSVPHLSIHLLHFEHFIIQFAIVPLNYRNVQPSGAFGMGKTNHMKTSKFPDKLV